MLIALTNLRVLTARVESMDFLECASLRVVRLATILSFSLCLRMRTSILPSVCMIYSICALLIGLILRVMNVSGGAQPQFVLGQDDTLFPTMKFYPTLSPPNDWSISLSQVTVRGSAVTTGSTSILIDSGLIC